MNGIERDLEGAAEVVRIDLLSAEGRAIARRYDVRAIRTLLVLADSGNRVYRRTGLPESKDLVALVRDLA